MSRRPSKYTESDIGRILKVAKRLDVHVRIEIKPDGTIVVTGAPQLGEEQQPNEWDEEYGAQSSKVR